MRKFGVGMRGTVLLAVAGLLAQTAAAQTPRPDPQVRPPRIAPLALAKTSGIEDMTLSPDGKWIALRSTDAGKVSFAVINAETRQIGRRFSVPPKTSLRWFRWAGNNKVLLSLSTTVLWQGGDARLTRLYYFDLLTEQVTMVARKEMGLDGDDLIYTDPAGEYVLMSMQRSVYDYPSVWRFPLTPDAMKAAREIQPQRAMVWNWFADNKGTVRIGFEYTSGRKLKIWYRRKAEDEFKAVAKLDEDSSDDEWIDVERIFNDSDEGYVLKKDDSGRVALRKFNYATRQAGETVYAAPGWDVTEAYIGDDNQPIAATYTDDRDRIVWFDPKLKSLQTRLGKALTPSDVWITSRARDDSRMLVFAGREDDPGGYYIYTAAKGTLDPFSAVLPELDPADLAAPQPVDYTARDGTKIRAYLTLPRGRDPKGLPLILLPHGGPYGVRDQLSFDGEVQLLANRGYAVLQPNFRGSGGFGEAFSDLGEGQIGRAMQDDLDDAMDWAVQQGVADPARVCVVGASYGGYAALWAVIRNPERYRCAASFAGVTDWNKQLKYDADFFSSKGAKKWRSRVQGDDGKFNLDLVSPAPQAARLTRPVLLAHGKDDSTVPFKQFKLMQAAAAKSKLVEPLVFAEEGHGFDRIENRQKWYETLDAFLTKHNPAE